MASAHPVALDPDSNSRAPTPLIIFPHSPSPSHHSRRIRAIPKPILGKPKSDRLDTPTTHISSFATHTLRPSPDHSLQATIKGAGPYLSSYQQMLERLKSAHHGSSVTTVKAVSRHPHDLARLKVDELDFEVCCLCDAERGKDDIEMKELPVWGLQWVCKEGCRVEDEDEDEGEEISEAEPESPDIGRDQDRQAEYKP